MSNVTDPEYMQTWLKACQEQIERGTMSQEQLDYMLTVLSEEGQTDQRNYDRAYIESCVNHPY